MPRPLACEPRSRWHLRAPRLTRASRHLAFNFPLAKLYTNSLLSTLNARSTANAVGPFGGGSSGEATRVGPRANMHRQQSEFAIGGWKGEPMELEFTPGQSHTVSVAAIAYVARALADVVCVWRYRVRCTRHMTTTRRITRRSRRRGCSSTSRR